MKISHKWWKISIHTWRYQESTMHIKQNKWKVNSNMTVNVWSKDRGTTIKVTKEKWYTAYKRIISRLVINTTDISIIYLKCWSKIISVWNCVSVKTFLINVFKLHYSWCTILYNKILFLRPEMEYNHFPLR